MTLRIPHWLWRVVGAAVVALAVGAVLAAGLAGNRTQAGQAGDLPITLRPDQPAPALTGMTFAGRPFDLAALRGRVVVINVMASWCPPCRVELPVLTAAARRWQPEGVDVVAIAMRDKAADVAEVLRETGAQTLTVVDDPQATRSVSLGARGVPETFVVDRGGVVRLHAVGPVTEDWLDRSLSQLESGSGT